MKKSLDDSYDESADEIESGFLEESLRSLLKESQKKIKEITRKEKAFQDMTTSNFADVHTLAPPPKERPSTSSGQVYRGDKPSRTKKVDPRRMSFGQDSEKTPERKVQLKKEWRKRPYVKPEPKLTPKQKLEQKAMERRIVERPSRFKGNNALKYDFSSDDDIEENNSVDTVKRNTNSKAKSASKKKKKHKITMHMHHDRPEFTLIRHFLQTGEWKKSHKQDESMFVYVCNERKLDWDISLRSLVIDY